MQRTKLQARSSNLPLSYKNQRKEHKVTWNDCHLSMWNLNHLVAFNITWWSREGIKMLKLHLCLLCNSWRQREIETQKWRTPFSSELRPVAELLSLMTKKTRNFFKRRDDLIPLDCELWKNNVSLLSIDFPTTYIGSMLNYDRANARVHHFQWKLLSNMSYCGMVFRMWPLCQHHHHHLRTFINTNSGAS